MTGVARENHLVELLMQQNDLSFHVLASALHRAHHFLGNCHSIYSNLTSSSVLLLLLLSAAGQIPRDSPYSLHGLLLPLSTTTASSLWWKSQDAYGSFILDLTPPPPFCFIFLFLPVLNEVNRAISVVWRGAGEELRQQDEWGACFTLSDGAATRRAAILSPTRVNCCKLCRLFIAASSRASSIFMRN